MFIQKIKTQGLAHLSYVLGSAGEAAIIDPRRDVDVYLDATFGAGLRITHIFETHRNEDLVSGAKILSELTGAPVWHGPNPAEPVAYARTAREGMSFDIGSVRLDVLETPGHTDDSISLAIFDREFDDSAVGVFTGDALFVGDVGRTDFYPDRAAEVAGLLYDSLQKLQRLGDQALIYPAHGAGSVCGSGMAEREFSSIGHERRNNQRLQITDRQAFIEAKLAERHQQPPYFALMEHLNTIGSESAPAPLQRPPRTLDQIDQDRTILVDIRGIADFAGAHIPASLCIPDDMLAAFAGWLLDPDSSLTLIARDPGQARQAAITLARIGYDNVCGFHAGIMPTATSDRSFDTLRMVGSDIVEKRLADRDGWELLDVRSPDEFEDGHIDGARNIYLGHLPAKLASIDNRKSLTVMCGSGARATIAASYLRRNGAADVDVYLGSWKAWSARH
jgi:hydroxyacylglutathione hydrolase